MPEGNEELVFEPRRGGGGTIRGKPPAHCQAKFCVSKVFLKMMTTFQKPKDAEKQPVSEKAG